MITEILVRCHTPTLIPLQEEICATILAETNLNSKTVDHTTLTINDFDIGDSYPISLDRYLATKFGIGHMRVSRIFDFDGDIIGRKVSIAEIADDVDRSDICVIDTDIMLGNTIRYACDYLKTKK